MIRGLHHFGLTVRDVDTSAAWYQEVPGFRCVGESAAPGGERRKVVSDTMACRLDWGSRSTGRAAGTR